MRYILRMIIAPAVYFFCFVIAALGIQSFNGLQMAGRIILGAVCLVIYILCVTGIMLKEGENAFSKLLSNDMQRKNMIKTGKDTDIDDRTEYRPYKAFLSGLVCCIPLIVLFIIHLVVREPGETSQISKIAEILYSPFFLFFGNYKTSNEISFFIGSAFTVVIFPCLMGVPYIFGAHKRKAQNDAIVDLNKYLHGDEE